MNFKSIISASRLRTLPLALSCIITGNAIAFYFDAFSWKIFGLSILTTILLQVLSNFSNDLGDSEKGTDNVERIGPIRAIQSGEISNSEMKNLIKITSMLALISGILLILVSNILWIEKLILFLIGLSGIWAANNYTQGKTAYGYRALGDLFVFLFFGIIGVVGSQFLSIHTINPSSFLPAIGVGALSTAVLHLNNMRDFVNDKNSNKITVAIKLGFENSKIYFLLLILTAMISWGSYVYTQNFEFSIDIYTAIKFCYWLGFIPLLMIVKKFFQIKESIQYDGLLKPLALTTFCISILFFISLYI